MVKKKTKSKRVTLRLKYNIERKAKEKRRKARRFARLHPEMVMRKKQDPGIPNLYPFKEALLDKIQRQQERLEEAKETQRSMREKMAAKRRAEIAKNVREAANNVAGAYARAPEAAPEELKGNARDLNRKKWFMRDLRKVLEESDVILEVLDARDPLGCRCPDIERLILGRYSQRAARPKRIILVLNKIDLVPPDVVAAWVQYLRREFPTIAFKSSTQGQSSHLAQRDLSMRKLKEGEGRAAASSGAFGANALVMLLKKYSLSLGIKTAINVGVIGYPNVGKSSIVNSLKRQRSVGVSATPGFTRQLQYVRLDQHVMLVDSPGVIFSAEEEDSDLLLRNCLRVEQLQDPERAVALLLKKCPAEKLMEHYAIAAFRDTDEFLFNLATKFNKFKKGGVPDPSAAARMVLQDWNEGGIPYYTLPPRTRPSAHESAEIVAQFAPELDVDALLNEANDSVIRSLPMRRRADFMQIEPSETRRVEVVYDGLSDEEDEEAAAPAPSAPKAASARNGDGKADYDDLDGDDAMREGDDDDGGNGDGDGDGRSGAMRDERPRAAAAAGAAGAAAAGAPRKQLVRLDDEENPQLNRMQRKQSKASKKQQEKKERRRHRQEDGAAAAPSGAAAAPADAYSFDVWN